MDVICATLQTLSNIFDGVAFNCPVKNQYLLSEKYLHNSNFITEEFSLFWFNKLAQAKITDIFKSWEFIIKSELQWSERSV